MTLTGEYGPSPRARTREQVERYEATDGSEGNTHDETGLPVVIFTTRRRKSGKIRKMALMRVEHEGKYAMIASMGGAPRHPEWYYNVKADLDALMVQDGSDRFDAHARELEGEEREIWWQRGRGVPAVCGISEANRPQDSRFPSRATRLSDQSTQWLP